MKYIAITNPEERYINDVYQYAVLVGKTDPLKTEQGLLEICKEYNEAYEKFTEKVLKLDGAKKQTLMRVLATDAYYEVNKRTEINKIFAEY